MEANEEWATGESTKCLSFIIIVYTSSDRLKNLVIPACHFLWVFLILLYFREADAITFGNLLKTSDPMDGVLGIHPSCISNSAAIWVIFKVISLSRLGFDLV